MRYSMLDDLVDPLTGDVLRIENAETLPRPGGAGRRCERWCGRLGRPIVEVDVEECQACQDEWIVAGDLVRTGDASVRYPIINGIPRLSPLSFYRGQWLGLMVADAIGRFATPIKNRYSRREIRDWLGGYGSDVTFLAKEPFSIAFAGRPHSSYGGSQ